MARAEQVVERGPAPRDALDHDDLVRRAVRNLRERHECNHQGRWRKVTFGNLQCEECSKRLPEYLLECGQCNLRACVRCRRNRL